MNGQALSVTRNSLIHLALQDALIQWAVNMLKYLVCLLLFRLLNIFGSICSVMHYSNLIYCEICIVVAMILVIFDFGFL